MWGNAAFGKDSGGFDDGETRAVKGERAMVDLVEGSEGTVIGGVGAHWGDNDTVGDSEGAEGEGGEKFRCGGDIGGVGAWSGGLVGRVERDAGGRGVYRERAVCGSHCGGVSWGS